MSKSAQSSHLHSVVDELQVTTSSFPLLFVCFVVFFRESICIDRWSPISQYTIYKE